MKVVDEMIKSSIMECAKRYNFDGEEALREILGGERKVRREKKEKKEKKEKELNIPLPFSEEEVKESGCQGLKYNHGLFTQCENSRDSEEEEYCSMCKKETEVTENKLPYCGTVSGRKKVGLMEYRDKNGRKPIGYLEVLEKKHIDKEVAIAYMNKIGYKYDNMHLETYKKEGRRGRPKKEGKEVVISDVEDMFAKLAIDSQLPVVEIEKVNAAKEELFAKLVSEALDEEGSVASNISSLTTESKKEAKKAEKETKKAEKESKRVEKEAKKAEKEAKKAEKETKKAEKEAKKAEKEAKKAEKEAKKANKEVKEEDKNTNGENEKIKTPPILEENKSEEPTKVKVKRIEIKGKTYLLSSANILYDEKTKDEVGIYDEETKTIKELPDDDDSEIEEEEYDDSDEDE